MLRMSIAVLLSKFGSNWLHATFTVFFHNIPFKECELWRVFLCPRVPAGAKMTRNPFLLPRQVRPVLSKPVCNRRFCMLKK